MASSAWLIGYITLPQQTWTFDGAVATLAAGTYALRHSTSALSLIAAFDAANLAATPTTVTSTTTILRNRRVHVVFSSAAALTWGAGGALLEAALGFTANLPSQTTHDAAAPSPLLWSPGFIATPKTIRGVDGYTVPHQSVYKSDDGTQVYGAHYGDETWQDLGWSHILPERMRVDDSQNGGGTFHEFWEQVGKLHRRFRYYEDIDEDDASSTAVTWTTARGPYVLREVDGDWYRRNVPNAEVSCSLELLLHRIAEVA